MSDWMDLQLAHSLAPAKAPDALWARVNARIDMPAPAAASPWIGMFRWAAPCAVAVAVLLLLVRATAIELRPAHAEFVSNDPIAVERWLAHEAGVAVPLRPAPGVQVKSARVVRQGVVAVAYEVEGRKESVTITRGTAVVPCKLPGYLVVAANGSRTDASCKLCHSL